MKKLVEVLVVQEKVLTLHSHGNELWGQRDMGNGNTTDSGPVIPGSESGYPTGERVEFSTFLFPFNSLNILPDRVWSDSYFYSHFRQYMGVGMGMCAESLYGM